MGVAVGATVGAGGSLCAEFKTTHVLSTVRVLMGEKDAVFAYLRASAILMNFSVAIIPLRVMFERLYKPVKPFSVFYDESQAKDFLHNESCTP